MNIASHKDLIVWQKSMDLVVLVYDATNSLPKNELYGLTAQMRRSVTSIPSNIAEGRRRGTKKDFRRFLTIAFGSGAELETQLEIVKRLQFVDSKTLEKIVLLLEEIMKMLNVIIRKLNPTS